MPDIYDHLFNNVYIHITLLKQNFWFIIDIVTGVDKKMICWHSIICTFALFVILDIMFPTDLYT